jgi:hypothetical protein
MKCHLPVFATLAMSLMSGTFVSSLKASEFDKKTIMTISQPVAVAGTLLPAGQYVLKLPDAETTGSVVVYIFNGDETRLITTVLALHAYRPQPADKSEFSFYDSPAGQPMALHTWFYPGDEIGIEFLPQTLHMAAAGISAAGN